MELLAKLQRTERDLQEARQSQPKEHEDSVIIDKGDLNESAITKI